MTFLLAANAIAAVAGIAFAVMGGARPAALSDSGTPTGGERFYGWMYAARGVPLGAAAAIAPLAWPGAACSLILFAAAAAQAGDAIIGVATRKRTMIDRVRAALRRIARRIVAEEPRELRLPELAAASN